MADFRDLNNSAETIEDLREWYNLSSGAEAGKRVSETNKKVDETRKELTNVAFAQESDRERFNEIQKQVATGIMSLDNFSNVMYRNRNAYIGSRITIIYDDTEPNITDLNIGDLFYNTNLKIAYRVEDNPKRFKEIDTPSFELAIANEKFVNDRGKRTFYVIDEPSEYQDGDFYLAENRKLYEYTNGELKLAIRYIDSVFSQTVYQALDDFKTDDFYNATHMIDSSTGEIISTTEHITRNKTSINSIKQDVDGIVLEQENTERLVNHSLGENKVLIENAKNELLLQGNILVNRDKTMYLYPSGDLYPSGNIYPNDEGE